MLWHVKKNRALHQHLLALTVATDSVPWVDAATRVTVERIAPDFFRAMARYGFMERPDVPALLRQAKALGCAVDMTDVTFYVGHETVLRRADHKGLPGWQEHLFAFLQRNAAQLSDFLNLPSDATVEIGRQVEI